LAGFQVITYGRFWVITEAWNIAHGKLNMPAYFVDSTGAKTALANETVAFAAWDATAQRLTVSLRHPNQNEKDVPN
jgi:hypothetical protein